jgi:hypothetical protein
MITSFDSIKNLFNEIDSVLKTNTNIYVIGGAALMFSKLKGFTKDIDLIAKTKSDYDSFMGAIKELGFKDTVLTVGAYMLNISTTQGRGEARIDLFLERVCGKMHLSDNMVERSSSIFKGNKLGIFVCSKEDIFLFKSITMRDGDVQDCGELIKSGLNWKIISNEMDYQLKFGEQIWLTHINERFIELEKKGFNIPIIKEVEKRAEDWINDNLDKSKIGDTHKSDLPKAKTNLDKKLDEIAKKTMRDYKQVFKKLEKY